MDSKHKWMENLDEKMQDYIDNHGWRRFFDYKYSFNEMPPCPITYAYIYWKKMQHQGYVINEGLSEIEKESSLIPSNVFGSIVEAILTSALIITAMREGFETVLLEYPVQNELQKIQFGEKEKIENNYSGDNRDNLTITLQKPIVSSYGNYRVDIFLKADHASRQYFAKKEAEQIIDNPNNFEGIEEPCLIIECDGHEFHEKTKEQARNDKRRDRSMIIDGFKILRFTGSEIWENPIAVAEEIFGYFEKLFYKNEIKYLENFGIIGNRLYRTIKSLK